MKPIVQQQNNSASEDCRAIRAVLEDSERIFEFGGEIASHIEKCRACSLHSEQLTKLRQLLASQPRVKAPADFNIKLRRRLVEAQSGKPAFWRFIVQPVGAMATAAAIVGLAATITVTRFVQKPGHLGDLQSPTAVSSKYSAESSKPESANPIASSETPMRLKTNITATADVGETSAVSSAPEPEIAAVKRSANRGFRDSREIRYINGEFSKPKESADDFIVVIQDRSNRSHSVPIKMVTYGSQPVVNLGTLVSPGEAEDSQSSDDESRIF